MKITTTLYHGKPFFVDIYNIKIRYSYVENCGTIERPSVRRDHDVA